MKTSSIRTLGSLALLTLAAACASSGNKTAVVPEPYMRIMRPDSNTVELQIAVRQFVPRGRSGPVIWLAAASHIGESNYYATLQRHLDQQALVLFEGVLDEQEKSAGRTLGGAKTRRAEKKSAEGIDPGSLQTTMAQSLGLQFQLDAIDYNRANFRNSDLSVQQLQTLMRDELSPEKKRAGGKGGKGSQEFDNLLKMMDGSSLMGAALMLGMKFIGSSPKLQAVTRLMMIEMLGQLKGDFTQMKSLPPDLKRLVIVLIEERNKAVIDDLKTIVKQKDAPRTISVFYGAGHMDDMERRLTGELKYRAAEGHWLPAFSVNTVKSGISRTEADWIRKLVKGMMETVQK